MPLPSYPWQRKRFWFDQIPGSTQSGDSGADEGSHPLLGRGVAVAGTNQRIWQKELSARQPVWLADHRVFGDVVLRGCRLLEMALAAAREIWPGAAVTVADVRFESPLRLRDQPAPVQLALERTEDGGTFTLYGGGPDWKRHAKGALRITPLGSVPMPLDLDEVRRRCPREIAPADHYAALLSGRLEYGPAFRGITRLWGGEREALGELTLPRNGRGGLGIHPALLDSALQVAAAAVTAVHRYLPEGVSGWTMYGGVPDRTYCRALVSGTPGDEELTADLDLCDARGQVFAHLAGLRLKRISAARDPLRGHCGKRPGRRVRWPGNSSRSKGVWLLLGEAGGLAERVAAELKSRGQEACVAGDTAPEEWRGVVHFAEGREAWAGACTRRNRWRLLPHLPVCGW